jgi:ABC-type nickel/cobalt efflux system permease component RcnA
MSFRTTIVALLQTVLTLSVVVVYGVGSVVAVEIEHDHGDDHSVESTKAPHEHHHHNHDDHHHHDDHNGGEDDRGGETPDDEENSSSHHHSHVVSFETQVATNFVNLLASTVGNLLNERFVSEKDLCPDGPFYELSKPPQLG